MPNGLLLIGATIGFGALSSLLFPAGFRREVPPAARVPQKPILTPGQEAAAEIGLRERQFQFERETQATTLALASRLRTEELIRLSRERERIESLRQEALVREEERQRLAFAERDRILKERQDAELRARTLELEDRRFAAELADSVRRQAAQQANFAAFVRGIPRDFTPVLRPDGSFTALPPGSLLTPADVARGLEPLPFSIPEPTAARLFQVPGVFVGPGFRFKSVVEAQDFLLSARLRG